MLVRERLLSVSALSLLELALELEQEQELELALRFDLERGGVEAAWDKMSNPAEVETGPFACAFGCALPLPLPLTFVGCLPASRETSCCSSSSSPKSMQGKRVCQAQTKQETNHKTNTCQLCHCCGSSFLSPSALAAQYQLPSLCSPDSRSPSLGYE